jgi:hypothetical protein
MEYPGWSNSYGWDYPTQPANTFGYPQGWEPIPDMPAPPGYMWGSYEAGYDGFFGGGGGFGGFGGLYEGAGGWGGVWPGPHGTHHWDHPMAAMNSQTGPGIYNDGSMAYASRAPPNNDGMPGVNLTNSVGGIGAEPGYNYIYPPDHAKVHVLYSNDPPWHNNGQYMMHCFHVPTSISCKELMQQFGCKNGEKEKNAVVELAEGNNGRWYKGRVWRGDDNDTMKMAISDEGWTKDRDGVKMPVVFCWFTNDYKPSW